MRGQITPCTTNSSHPKRQHKQPLQNLQANSGLLNSKFRSSPIHTTGLNFESRPAPSELAASILASTLESHFRVNNASLFAEVEAVVILSTNIDGVIEIVPESIWDTCAM